MGKGIELVDLLVVVGIQELAGIVPAEAEGHLGQVVGAEGEELGLLGDLISGEGSPGDLNHGAYLVVHVGAGLGDELVGSLHHHVLHVLQFLDLAHQGNHDLGDDVVLGMLLHHIEGGSDDGGGLHFRNLGIGHGQAAATVAHHGVELMEGGDDVLQLLHGDVQLLGDFHDVLLLRGQELVEGGSRKRTVMGRPSSSLYMASKSPC